MTSRVRHRRQLVAGAALPELPLEPGELALNLADLKLFSTISGTPMELFGVRRWAGTAQYAINDLVANAGRLYAANQAIAPEAFTPAKWDVLARQIDVDASMTAHLAAVDPHPQYMTSMEVDTSIAAHVALADPHPQYTTAAELSAAIAAHAAAADPHPVYITQAELDAFVLTGAWLPLVGGTLTGPLIVQANVGIGTAAPTDSTAYGGRVLDVAGPGYFRQAGTPANFFAVGVAGGIAYVQAAPAISMSFFTGGADRLQIAPNGNVGLGVAAAGPKLLVGGQLTTVLPAGSDNFFNYLTSGVANTVLGFNDTAAANPNGVPAHSAYVGTLNAFPLTFLANGTAFGIFSTAGNFGVGTLNPVVRFHAAGPDATARCRLQSTNSGGVIMESAADGANSGAIGTVTNHPFLITTNSAVRMQIDAVGNVGIGTTGALSGALEVVRAATVDLTLRGGGNTFANGFGLLQNALNEAYVFNRANGSMIFGTNNVSRVLIRNTGHMDVLVGSGGFLIGGNATRFATALIAPPVGGALISQVHGGVRAPDVYNWVLTCVTAEHGWGVGDEINLSCNDISDPARQLTTVANASGVFLLFNAAAGLQMAIRPNNPAAVPVSITNANWRLSCKGHWL